ncbi:MAG: HlyD family secretion protein [Desulfovibrionaceae bacterium]|nr:HlyD family secretion protein [Desulfovibrionaceae bacterium]
MSDSLKLPPAQGSKARWRWLVPGLILLAGAAVWLYGHYASSVVVSRQAMVEGRVYAMTAPVTGVVRAVPVLEGQAVERGAPLLLMDDVPLRSALAEALEALGTARQGGVPLAEADPAARERRENAERQADMYRADEEAARGALEHWTAEHARAVLTLRRPDAVSGPARDQAVADEAAARRRVEAARQSLTEASRHRAEADAQARRAREGAGSILPGPAQVALWEARVAQAERDLDAATLSAPEAGTVLRVSVAPGQPVNRGDSMLVLIPSGGSGLWVTAFFDRRDMLRLRPGQACRITADGGPSLAGVLESLLPGGDGGTARISLTDSSAGAGLRVGQPVSVTVRAF